MLRVSGIGTKIGSRNVLSCVLRILRNTIENNHQLSASSIKVIQSCFAKNASFVHVLRSAGAHALAPVPLFVWQCSVS